MNAQIPVYYINLSSRPDRRAFMERQFHALGIVAERIEALTPGDLSMKDRQAFCNPDRLHWMTEAELACNLSHARAWRALVETGASAGLVLEDDSLLSPQLPELLAAIAAAPALAAPVIRIESVGARHQYGPLEPGPLPSIGLRRCFTRDSGAGAYILSPRAAGALLDAATLKTSLVDSLLFNPIGPLALELRPRYTDPSLSMQQVLIAAGSSEGVSDLSRSRADRYREGKRRPLRRWLAKAGSWVTYDIRMALSGLGRLGRRDLQWLTIPLAPMPAVDPPAYDASAAQQ